MFAKQSFIAFVFICLVLNLQAQRNRNSDNRNSRDRNPSLSFGFQLADPLENLSNHFGTVYPGLEGQLLFNLRQTPLEVGIGYAWNYLGSQQRDIALIVGEDDGTDIYASGSSQISFDNQRAYAIGRFEPVAWRIQPYADAMIGVQRFSATQVIEREYASYSEIASKEVVQQSLAPMTGFGFGLKWKLNRWFMAETRYQYLQGFGQKMIAPSTIHMDQHGVTSWENTSTNTTIQTFQIGLSVEF